MTIYVRAKKVDSPNLTAGKIYNVTRPGASSNSFYIISDDGDEQCCLWEGCSHLPRGVKWERIALSEYASDHIPRDMEPAVSAAWAAIYKLSLAHRSEVALHRTVILDMRDKLNEIIERVNK